jgi:CHAT domain-containing protein
VWSTSPARVATFADALSQFFNDRYFKDVAAAMGNAQSQLGHRRFAEARHSPDPVPLYDEAARSLQKGGSPQWLPARIACTALKTLQTNDYAAALKELDALAADARQYPSVMAYLEQNRLFLDQYANRYNEFFASYDAARAQYGRVRDWEDLAAVATHSIATMSVVGMAKPAWREAFVEMRDVARLPSLKTRFLLVGATVDAALGLQHAEAALLYQSSIVESARNKAPGFFVSILEHRARIEAGLGDYAAARRDLDDAGRVAGVDPRVRQLLEARLAEAEGEAALHADPRRAVDALTRAIGLAAPEYATFRAALFAERAEAFNRGRNPARAEADRREALNQLHAEEEATLRGRKPGKADDLWISYFSRFEETYDLLIRQLIDDGRADEAFRYAERARAYEPLDLVRRLPSAPAAFRELAAHADNVDVAKLQAQLPPNTFLIEYRVFEDQTYAWILGRNLVTAQRVPARRGDVKRWTAALQNAANAKDSAAFDAVLEPPYDGLLRAPLEVIRRSPGGAAAKIVIVPDRELRGLPFAALRNPDTKRYVIQDHVLSMSGSALLYVFAVLRDRELAARDASALLIADPAFDPNSTLAQGLQRLQHARQEAGALHSLYPDAEVLVDEAATPERFLQSARGKAIIHIAAHGVVNGDAPSQSFLLFTGLLTAEMLVKDLHAEKTRLVVLGACSSAGGLPVGAEGIAPLVRPIVGAGVPGVVGALWDIDDATAAGLLVSFHRHYRQGSDAATALREAQVDMLRSGNPGETPARVWAPYQVIGYVSSPFASIGDINKEKPP